MSEWVEIAKGLADMSLGSLVLFVVGIACGCGLMLRVAKQAKEEAQKAIERLGGSEKIVTDLRKEVLRLEEKGTELHLNGNVLGDELGGLRTAINKLISNLGLSIRDGRVWVNLTGYSSMLPEDEQLKSLLLSLGVREQGQEYESPDSF